MPSVGSFYEIPSPNNICVNISALLLNVIDRRSLPLSKIKSFTLPFLSLQGCHFSNSPLSFLHNSILLLCYNIFIITFFHQKCNNVFISFSSNTTQFFLACICRKTWNNWQLTLFSVPLPFPFKSPQIRLLLLLFFFFFFYFVFLGLHPWPKDHTTALDAGLHHSHSHSNTRSEWHLQPTPWLMAMLDL